MEDIYTRSNPSLENNLQNFSPSRILINQRLLKLHRYISRNRSRSRIPILLIPPLMVRPYLYDLNIDQSFVRWLLACGYDVFLVDFGIPLRRDSQISLETYVVRWIHRIVRKIKKVTNCKEISLVGYCMGGILANIYASIYPNEGVRNVVSIATPTDFDQMPGYQRLASILKSPLFEIADVYGYIPASLVRMGFYIGSPPKVILRPLKFLWNILDNNYLQTYSGISQWLNEFVNCPNATFKEFWNSILLNNQLYTKKLFIMGKQVNLKNIDASYLALAGQEDQLVSQECSEAILNCISTRDKHFEIVSGGHLGLLIGKQSQVAWKHVTDWLAVRSHL